MSNRKGSARDVLERSVREAKKRELEAERERQKAEPCRRLRERLSRGASAVGFDTCRWHGAHDDPIFQDDVLPAYDLQVRVFRGWHLDAEEVALWSQTAVDLWVKLALSLCEVGQAEAVEQLAVHDIVDSTQELRRLDADVCGASAFEVVQFAHALMVECLDAVREDGMDLSEGEFSEFAALLVQVREQRPGVAGMWPAYFRALEHILAPEAEAHEQTDAKGSVRENGQSPTTCAAADVDVLPAASVAQMRWKGGSVIVSWRGEDLPMRSDTGLPMLAEMLRSPGRVFSPEELEAAAGRRTPADEPIGDEDASADNLKSNESAQPRIDDEAARAIKDAIEEVEARRDVGEATDDDVAEFRRVLLEHTGGSIFELNRALKGRGRLLKSPSTASAKRVGMALRRSIAKLGELSPSLREHLKSGIRSYESRSLTFEPVESVTWLIER